MSCGSVTFRRIEAIPVRWPWDKYDLTWSMKYKLNLRVKVRCRRTLTWSKWLPLKVLLKTQNYLVSCSFCLVQFLFFCFFLTSTSSYLFIYLICFWYSNSHLWVQKEAQHMQTCLPEGLVARICLIWGMFTYE